MYVLMYVVTGATGNTGSVVAHRLLNHGMAGALNSGHMRALEPQSDRNTTPTSFETFVTEEFVPLYKSQPRAA
jgi:nucleoside-diphosphate-sugar epimerase